MYKERITLQIPQLTMVHDKAFRFMTGLYEMTNIFLINSLETTNVYRELQYHSLLTLPEYLSSSPVFSGVRVTRSLVLYVCVVDRCSSFCTFSFGHCVVCSFGHCVVCSFGHCVVCSSSIYGF